MMQCARVDSGLMTMAQWQQFRIGTDSPRAHKADAMSKSPVRSHCEVVGEEACRLKRGCNLLSYVRPMQASAFV